jgi:hypothetical protein
MNACISEGRADESIFTEDENPVWRHVCRITSNVYVGKTIERVVDDDQMLTCHCPPDGPVACGDACLNRQLFIECPPSCPNGTRCTNRRLTNGENARLAVGQSGVAGLGVFARGDIPVGTFLVEYVGEVIDRDEYVRRKRMYLQQGRTNTYFMDLGGGFTIDALAQGGIGRFFNHSCDPNCEVQKWMVDGRPTIGLFSRRDIERGTELTFDYNYQLDGDVWFTCLCGSSSCRGTIGGPVSVCTRPLSERDPTVYNAHDGRGIRIDRPVVLDTFNIAARYHGIHPDDVIKNTRSIDFLHIVRVLMGRIVERVGTTTRPLTDVDVLVYFVSEYLQHDIWSRVKSLNV